MKKIITISGLALASVWTASAQFTRGDLAVLQIGDGTRTLSTAGNSDFILDIPTSGGSPSYTDPIPNSVLVNSGSSTSEGALSLAADGQSLTLAGYTSGKSILTLPYVGTGGLPATASVPINRGVAQITAAGAVTLAGFTTNRLTGSTSSAGNPRTAVTDGNGNVWIGGASSSASSAGIFLTSYLTTTIYNTSGPRDLNIFNGNLYFTISSGLMGYTGLPTTTTTPSTIFNFTGNGSPQGFALSPDGTIAYVADSTAATGGVQKYVFSGGAWSLAYTLGAGEGIFGLAVNFATGDLYGTTRAVTSGSTLVEITDGGSASTSSSDTVLATAGAHEVYKGIAFAPASAPEPSAFALLGLGLLAVVQRHRRA